MGNVIEIEIRNGHEARSLVDPFYERNGGRACAREDDLFFLAMKGNGLAGCVRYCVENGTPMLRTMMVDQSCRREGIGSRLLLEFAAHLDNGNIHDVFCLPYSHLAAFYAMVRFAKVPSDEAPEFLKERMMAYDPAGTRYICMKRR